MKPIRLAAILLLVAACASSRGPQTSSAAAPGHGALTIEIVPNPIVATKIAGDTYEFPFEVVVRETAGHPVEVNRVTADVTALGAFQVATESYDAERIRSLGFATRVPANGELRYRFNPRKNVTDDRLFGGVSAEVRVDGTDELGAKTTAQTRVTIRR